MYVEMIIQTTILSTFKPYNLMKSNLVIVFWKTLEMSYKNM